jgi:hypothetical protein
MENKKNNSNSKPQSRNKEKFKAFRNVFDNDYYTLNQRLHALQQITVGERANDRKAWGGYIMQIADSDKYYEVRLLARSLRGKRSDYLEAKLKVEKLKLFRESIWNLGEIAKEQKYDMFQTLISTEATVERSFVILEEYNRFDCEASRELLLKLSQEHGHSAIRTKAYELYVSLNSSMDTPLISTKIHTEGNYKYFQEHFKEITKELGIDSVHGYKNTKRKVFNDLFFERYPDDVNLIMSDLSRNENKEAKRDIEEFWVRECRAIYGIEPIKKKHGKRK